MMPGGRHSDGSEENSGAVSLSGNSSQSQMVVPTPGTTGST